MFDCRYLVIAKFFGCQGDEEVFQLTSTAQEITSDLVGSFTGKVIVLDNPATPAGWVQYLPSKLLVPNFKSPVEAIALVLCISALLSLVGSLLWGMICTNS